MQVSGALKQFKSDQFASRTNNTNYQAAEDGFVVASGAHQDANALTFTVYEGPANPAANRRVNSYSATMNFDIPCVFPVKRGRWYRVVASYTGTPTLEIGWVPCSY